MRQIVPICNVKSNHHDMGQTLGALTLIQKNNIIGVCYITIMSH